MKYFYWLGAAAVIALGIYFSTQISVKPQSLSKLELTQVAVPEDLGKLVFENLRREVKAAPVLMLGVTPNQIEDLELWRGFLEANQEQGSKYDLIVVESMLPYVEIFNNGMHLQVKDEMPRMVEGINKALAQGLRVVIIVPSIYASQLIKSNPVSRLKEEFKVDVTSMSVSKFPLTREQEASFDPACSAGGAVDPAGTSALGCMVRDIARKTYRKKFEANKYSGLLEQTGAKDYLILFNRN
ncbi:hypothetical protein [Bdellovibrio svalbardensis]|uniref:SGNH/GDSL hydrolase family protein n=1 Tax=Bdellovibrio svalbardensis TaxID=2972972 RepID=A0ABT6DEL4_9BACT|nr:hypothetical protein [Bdellovibrio svalbardensis]MDG0815233.1 hypothetical protein [Bdellovibrio svalbardensis]